MKILITGGAGFIGSNLAYALLSRSHEVTIYDNLSRKFVEKNLGWLKTNSKNGKLNIVIDDVRNKTSIEKAVKGKDAIFHLAAQTAVTQSIKNPVDDLEINILGTINVLEAIRKYTPNALAAYSSTNKVYGNLDYLRYTQTKSRFVFLDKQFSAGISESFPLEFDSPYSCSKGVADQYFCNYSRMYGINSVIFRQSCVYGQMQHGSEGQGWVTYFLKQILQGKEIKIYGSGKQVRDILHIDDLTRAYLLVLKDSLKNGIVYNIGGGSNNTVSLLELINLIEKKYHKKAHYSLEKPRPGDQKIFFSDNKKICEELGWKASIGIEEGLDKLYQWLK